MSGLFDNRNDGKARREERSKKEQTSKRKHSRLTVTVVVVLLVVFIGAITINSNFIRRSATAITIGGRAFTAAEFDYFYNFGISEYTGFINEQMPPEFASAMLPVRGQLLSDQIQDPETGATWADFFRERAETSISQLVSLYNAANASGFVMSEEDIVAMEEAIDMQLMQADWAVMNGHVRTPAEYLQLMYGSSMNEAVLRDIFQFIFTAISYRDNVRESFTYTQAELEAFYLENSNQLDVFRYRILLVTPEVQNPMDFETGDELYAAQETALEETVALAQLFADTITSEEAFIEVARGFDEVLFSDPRSTLAMVQGEALDPTFADWLTDGARVYGDTMTFEAVNGTHVLFFVDRDDNNYHLTSMRQILLMRENVFPEDFPEGEDDPGFIAEMARVDQVARERGLAALAALEAGGGTEARLIELMEEHSDDHVPGGLYENIAMFPYESETGRLMTIVPELEEWLFDESRQIGDFELIRTEAFGYHLMFFAGRGEIFRDFIADDRMRTNDHRDWSDALPEVEAPRRHWGFILTTTN